MKPFLLFLLILYIIISLFSFTFFYACNNYYIVVVIIINLIFSSNRINKRNIPKYLKIDLIIIVSKLMLIKTIFNQRISYELIEY